MLRTDWHKRYLGPKSYKRSSDCKRIDEVKDYPNITWGVFDAINEDTTHNFEMMCRRIFISEYLKDTANPHNNYNNKGIEVLPILEPIRDDGQPRKRISFQAKYASTPQYAYGEFRKSAKITAKEYKGQLDLVYLFCNKTLTTDSNTMLIRHYIY